MITLHMANASAASVPGWIGTNVSAATEAAFTSGAIATTFVPL